MIFPLSPLKNSGHSHGSPAGEVGFDTLSQFVVSWAVVDGSLKMSMAQLKKMAQLGDHVRVGWFLVGFFNRWGAVHV